MSNEALSSALKSLRLANLDASLNDLVASLPMKGRLILFYNSGFDHWASSLREALPGERDKGYSRAGMSDSRAFWYVLSHVYVVNDLLALPVSSTAVTHFAPPLSPNTVRPKFARALALELLEQRKSPTNKSTELVSLTNKGRDLVESHVSWLAEQMDMILRPS